MEKTVEQEIPGLFQKFHTTLSAAQGMFFTTLKAILYGYGTTAIVMVFSIGLIALFSIATNFFGVGFASNMPAVDYIP